MHLFAVKERKRHLSSSELVVYFVDHFMGNRKSAPNMFGIAALGNQWSPQSVNKHTNPSESDEQRNKWNLSERDIAFLVSQTGKYKYLFYANLIKLGVLQEQSHSSTNH